jgi:protocatechuate 3,4-dioxygenase beta subunit
METGLRAAVRPFILGWVGVLTVALPEAQVPSAIPTRQITGHVSDARDGAPLRRARVTITIAGRVGDPVFSGDDGRFVIAEAPAPPFTLSVAKAGYTSNVVTPSAAQLVTPLQFALARSVAVTGRVVDSQGVPRSPGAPYVAARLLPDAAGQPGVPTRFYTQADRLGEYRLGGLAPGRYEITAIGIPPLQELAVSGKLEDSLFGPRDSFNVARVVTVALEPGDEARNIDFVVPGGSRSCDTKPGATQRPLTGGGRIQGRVLAASGELLVCAQVHISPSDVYVHTDAEGRYTFDALPAGSFTVKAYMPGYLSMGHGQRRPSDDETPVVVKEGDRRERVDVVLPRETVVTGTVVDEHGEPVQGISVWAFQQQRRSGRTVAVSRESARATDDRGQYRIIGLPPGSYLVGALARGDLTSADDAQGYVSSYHPATTSLPLARPVVVDAGAEVAAIDIVMSPVRIATVSGVILDPAGQPFSGTVSLTTSARSGGALFMSSRSAQTDAMGRFVIRSVPPGDYVLKAPGQGRSPLFGMHYITVTEVDPAPVNMKLTEGAELEGRLVLEVAPGTNPAGLELTYAGTDYDREPAVRNSSFVRELDGTFRMTSIFGPSRLTVPRMPGCETCYLKSARVNGVDASETPFDFGLDQRSYRDVEVVISDAGATIEGRASDDAEGRAAFAMVVLPTSELPRYPGSRYVKVGFRLNDGRFQAVGLPPGEYVVAAANSDDTSTVNFNPGDPDFAALLASRGTRVTVLERERAVVNLRLLRR